MYKQIIISLCLLAGGYTQAIAQPKITPLFSEPLQSVAKHSQLETESGVAQQFVRAVNSAVVSAENTQITLNIDSDLVLNATLENSYENQDGALIWEGAISADAIANGALASDQYDGSSVILVRRGTRIHGTIHVGEQTFKIEPLGDDTHVIKEIDPHSMPDDHPPGWEESAVVDMSMFDQLTQTASADAAAESAAIDLMVVYTPAVRNNIRGTIDLAIAETNAGYRSSNINAQVQLAHIAEINYRESGDMRLDLNRFAGRSDGYMDSVHGMLEREGADVAILITNGGGYCGIARGIGSNAESAYAIVAKNCATGNYTFAHEIGHLQGARHNPEQDSSTRPYAYGHGYANQDGGWRTVMSYNINSCCRRQNFWSNPRQTFRGAARGTASRHDNHRVLNITAPLMAGNRNRDTGTFALQAVHSGKCLDVVDFLQIDGANVIQWSCTGNVNQQWQLTDRGNGQLDIVARHSGRCLAVRPGSGELNNGQNIEQRTCDGSAGRRFSIIDRGNNVVSLRNVRSGRCLDIDGRQLEDDANALQWSCHNDNNQRFRLVPVDSPQNQAPRPNINGPYRGNVDTAIEFSSQGSSDPDGTITNYQWNFGDGGESNDANPQYRYTRAGTYEVSLTVMDDNGASQRATTTATISDSSTQVCFYQHSEYRGASFCARSGNYRDMPSGWNDVVSSVRVPSGQQVEIFQHSNFGGARLTLRGDITNLTAQGFNDRMSSFRIAAGSGGDWQAVASPSVDYRNDRSRGGRLFDSLVDDIDSYTHDIAREVVQILYKTPAQVPEFSELELRIENWDQNPSGVAWKAGRPPRITVNVNAYHLERVNAANRDVYDEVTGILYHEMTHAYQHSSNVQSSAIEGLADTVRYLAGYVPVSHRRRGGSWTSSYKTTGFFLAWIQEEKGYRNFVHDFNQQGNPANQSSWSWESAIRATTGENVQTLWNEYQTWLR